MAQIIEPTPVLDGEVTIGFVFIKGTGVRVGADMWGDVRHMRHAAARRLAKTLEATSEAEALAPAIEALTGAADRLEAWEGGQEDAIPGLMGALGVQGHA